VRRTPAALPVPVWTGRSTDTDGTVRPAAQTVRRARAWCWDEHDDYEDQTKHAP
jgi:hypothetical protein